MESSFSDGEETGSSALEQVFRAHFADLYRYIYRQVKHAMIAEDLTSVVFLKALRWLQQGRSEQQVKGWLYATARTTLVDYWREQAEVQLLPLEAAEDIPELSEEAGARQRAAQEHIQRLLALLSSRERAILTLRFFQGYSAAEIGRDLGLSPNNVRVLQLRALRRAALLEQEERSPAIDTSTATYNEQARQVLDFAQEEARGFHHKYIGTEHLLLGLLREGSAATELIDQGVTLDGIRGGVMFLLGRDQEREGSTLDYNPRMRKVLGLAEEEARAAGEREISPRHLLVGLWREGEGLGMGMLQTLGVQLERFCTFCHKKRSQVQRLFAAPPYGGGVGIVRVYICNECVGRFSDEMSG
jgi:RNA polymerase sigma factor (sigma-70 family)